MKSVTAPSTNVTEVIDPPAPRAASGSGRGGPTSASAVMLLDEIGRTRRLAAMGLGVSLFAIATLPLMGGDPLARSVALVGLSLFAAANVLLFAASRGEDTYRRGLVLSGWGLATLGLVASCYYYGLFSAAMAGPAIGLYYMTQGHRRLDALVVTSMAAVGYGLVMTLIALGVIDDRALLAWDDLTRAQQLVAVVFLELMVLLIYKLGRHSRSVLAAAIESSQRAHDEMRQARSLQREAEQEIRRVMRAGGPGRLSGCKVRGYQLGNLLGRGGMGEVYEAWAPSGREVAIKVLHERADELSERRFLREQRNLVSLEVPSIVKVLEVSAAADTPFIVMERLRGSDLASHLRERARLEPEEVSEMVGQLARALDEIAARGIAHRDLKPGNIFREQPHRRWTLLDFSISIVMDADSSLTEEGALVGTPAYMAPEQARGYAVGPAADRYSLAAIAFRCLTGHAPYTGSDIPSLVMQVAFEMPCRPSSYRSLSPDVDAFFAIALAKEPSQRFQSGRDMAQSFERALRGLLHSNWRQRAEDLVASNPWRTNAVTYEN